jgi:hypothetical protein
MAAINGSSRCASTGIAVPNFPVNIHSVPLDSSSAVTRPIIIFLV